MPTVRAVDVGYGHVKYTVGRDTTTGMTLTDHFPSQSPILHQAPEPSIVLSRRDTVIVPLNDRFYEVGKDVLNAMETFHDGAVLDQEFPLSDAYAARLYGALNYMYPQLPDHTIDLLVLGLPLTTIHRHRSALEHRFTGNLVINTRGQTINIKHVEVFPQPLGSYMAYLTANPSAGATQPKALVVDPGYNTVDWYVIQGYSPNDLKSGATQRGMSAVLRAIAAALAAPVEKGGVKEAQGASLRELERLIDRSLCSSQPFQLCGREIDLSPYMNAGDIVTADVAQTIRNQIGTGGDISVIILTGGGASLYAEEIRRKFPHHDVQMLKDPASANVRGFQYLGSKMAESAARAAGAHAAATT